MAFAHDSFQFYPTPASLAERAWAKFKNRNFVRVLEPSAGDGALAAKNPRAYEYGSRKSLPIDCVEIDITKHADLRKQGFSVVGVDFLTFNGSGAMYSHIIANPPFVTGVKHALKAWDLMFEGEIVVILNAETIRNPLCKERQMLVSLIEQHGSVEFIEGAFTVAEAERQTEVDVALVYLKKSSGFHRELVGSILDDLTKDHAAASLEAGFREMNEIALPNSSVENSVLAFNAAVRAKKEAIFTEARARYYTKLLGETLEQKNGDAPKKDDDESSLQWIRRELQSSYEDMKGRAWTGILRSTQVTSRMSSAAQRRLESEFEAIKTLEFTASNVYGFLLGLVESQGDIQIGMACDVFDLITRYHSDNTVFYKGWKSNDRHRTCAMRIKTTRFVIPGHRSESYQQNLSWDSLQMLRDFDKVFAMLDGKTAPDVSLEFVFNSEFRKLRNTGARVESSYFDVRYYAGVGTIHFFPRDKKLVDRLNRLVGRERKWLPPEGVRVSENFWLQFDKAEKFDKEVQAEIKVHCGNRYGNLSWSLRSDGSMEQQKALDAIDKAIGTVLERHNIDVDAMLEQAPEQPALMLRAA